MKLQSTKSYQISDNKFLQILCTEIEVPSFDGFGSDTVVSYEPHIVDFSEGTTTKADWERFKNIYGDMDVQNKKQFWHIFKALRPYRTLNELRPLLYKSKTVGTHDPYLIYVPVDGFKLFLTKNGFDFKVDIWSDEDLNPGIRKLENEYIKLTYSSLLLKRKN